MCGAAPKIVKFYVDSPLLSAYVGCDWDGKGLQTYVIIASRPKSVHMTGKLDNSGSLSGLLPQSNKATI